MIDLDPDIDRRHRPWDVYVMFLNCRDSDEFAMTVVDTHDRSLLSDSDIRSYTCNTYQDNDLIYTAGGLVPGAKV